MDGTGPDIGVAAKFPHAGDRQPRWSGAVWNLDSREDTLLTPEAGNVWALAISADGRTLAVGTQDGAIKLFSIPARREITTLKGHLTYVDALAFSPDGRLLVSSSGDGRTRLWSGVAAR